MERAKGDSDPLEKSALHWVVFGAFWVLLTALVVRAWPTDSLRAWIPPGVVAVLILGLVRGLRVRFSPAGEVELHVSRKAAAVEEVQAAAEARGSPAPSAERKRKILGLEHVTVHR